MFDKAVFMLALAFSFLLSSTVSMSALAVYRDFYNRPPMKDLWQSPTGGKDVDNGTVEDCLMFPKDPPGEDIAKSLFDDDDDDDGDENLKK